MLSNKINTISSYYYAYGTTFTTRCLQVRYYSLPEFLISINLMYGLNYYRCDECGYIVTRPRFLESHKQTHLPDNEKPFACNDCTRRFCWKSALRIHLISHQPASERKHYICHVCGRS